MSIKNINICRACLAKCQEDKVNFETVKDLFKELTTLQDTIDLPRYLCSKCNELLTQFKAFKDTCIESDTHLRKAISNTTLPLLPLEMIKVESQTYDAEDSLLLTSPTVPVKRKRKNTKKQEDYIDQKKTAQAKRKISGKQARVASPIGNDDLLEDDNKTEIEEEKFTRNHEEQVDSPTENGVEFEKRPKKGRPRGSQPIKKPKVSNELLHKCPKPKCNKGFRDELRLQIHIRKHDGIDPRICDICGKTLTTVRIMLRHRVTHKSREERSHKCMVCNKIMLTENSLRYHMKTHQASKEYVCDICGLGCVTNWALKSHRQTHNPDQSLFKCNLCPKTYGTYLNLYSHIKSKHGEKEKPVACNICGQVVSGKSLLFNHCKNKHTVYTTTENIFQCKHCDMKCKTPNSLKSHERLHTGERKYKCSICPKSFAHLELLKRHSYFHSGERPVHCEVCDKGFYQKCALDIHMNVHKKQWIAQGVQGITLTSYKQTKKAKTASTRPSEIDDFSADSSGYT